MWRCVVGRFAGKPTSAKPRPYPGLGVLAGSGAREAGGARLSVRGITAPLRGEEEQGGEGEVEREVCASVTLFFRLTLNA